MVKIAVSMRRILHPRGLAQLLVPTMIAALAFAAAIVWLKTIDAASSYRLSTVAAAEAAPTLPDPAVAPRPYTASYFSGLVPAEGGGRNIYLYISPSTSRYLASVGASYDALLAPWRYYFDQRGVFHIETDRLDSIQAHSRAVLILPSAVSLSARERRQLLEFQRMGGSILATWGAGARNGSGEWEGYGFLESLFGVKVTGELDRAGDERFLNLYGDSPLTMGYPAGRRIWLENTAEKALRLSGGNPAGAYLNWIRDVGPNRAGAAVLFDEHDAERHRARWVLFGFAESSWGRQAPDLEGLLDNALHWLARGASVTKTTWPVPYRAAYVIEMDTEEGFGNAHRFGGMMDKAGLKATFYCLTSEAIRYPYLVRNLSRRHEIAYHGDIHIGFRGQPEAEQSRRLDSMRRDMQSIVGADVVPVGFRAPLEQYDRTTERLLHAKGFLHHAADPNRTDARLPFFSSDSDPAPGKALVVLPRTQHDDIGMHAGKRYPGATQNLVRVMERDFDSVLEAGAFGLLSVHSQYFEKDSPLHDAMPEFLDSVVRHRDAVWFGAANDVANWWRERERLRYAVAGTSDSFVIDVTIDGDRPLEKGAIIVMHRSADALLSIQALQGDAPAPGIRRLDRFRTAITFDGLDAGSYSYRVSETDPPDDRTDAAPDSLP